MKKFSVRKLRPGMHVVALDRPWAGTPFPPEGFTIRDAQQLRRLAEHCRHVFIDPRRSPPLRLIRRTPQGEAGAGLLAHACRYVRAVFAAAGRGRAPQVSATRRLVARLLEAAPARVQDAADPDCGDSALHAVQTCLLALEFGRHLGLERSLLLELGMAALLHDVGETQLVGHTGEGEGERLRRARQHPRLGARLLERSGMPMSVAQAILTHHERSGGDGYPAGLRGRAIPFFARMVAIADFYENATRARADRPPMGHAMALKYLHDWRGRLFDAMLVERFIECQGVYPEGAAVELETGEIGLVVSANAVRGEMPQLLLVRGRNKTRLDPPRLIEPGRYVSAADGHPYAIIRVHDPVDFRIDVGAYLLRQLPAPRVQAG